MSSLSLTVRCRSGSETLGVESSAHPRPAPSEELVPACGFPGQAQWLWGWAGYQAGPGATSGPGHTALPLRFSSIPIVLSPLVLLLPPFLLKVLWLALAPTIPEDRASGRGGRRTQDMVQLTKLQSQTQRAPSRSRQPF